jgi:site-specific recombinase XerD
VPPNKGRKYPAEVIPREEVVKLLAACSSRAPTGIRNKALITVMYRGGLRISEVLSLMPRDIDIKAGTITVMNGKGGKRRVVGLDPEAFDCLARWIDRREQLGINGRARLFCTLKGEPLSAPYVRQALVRLAKRAGIDRRVNPHALRHSFAAEMAREGMPMNLIQQALGHSSLGTTSRYLAHINPQEVIDAMRSRKWEPGGDHSSGSSPSMQVRRSAPRRTDEASTARDGGDLD